MAFVSVTRLRIRQRRFLLPFFYRTIQAQLQARRAPGNLIVRLLNDTNRAYWTITVWQDQASMRAYMISGAHGKAMPRLMEWCDEAATAHWTQDDATPPTWVEAHQRLIREGRPSKVRHPSAAQDAFSVPPPRTT
jgi:heme-degrading monooxygenase HmoA